MLPSKDKMLRALAHQTVRETQDGVFTVLDGSSGAICEIPTGEGKTAIGMAVIKAAAAQGVRPNYYVTPTKTLVQQVERMHPNDVSVVMGRSEYPCYFYEDRGVMDVTAEASPCYMLDCPHRVDQITGQTQEAGATPCAYFLAKYRARAQTAEGRAIVCTTAFFLLNRNLVSGWRDEEPGVIVIDEAHQLANSARGVYEHTLTDFHLRRMARMVMKYDQDQARVLMRLLVKFMTMARKRNSLRPSLMNQDELAEMLAVVLQLDAARLEQVIQRAITAGDIDPVNDRSELKLLENLVRGIPRLVNAMRYSLADDTRQALNYVVAFYYKKEDTDQEESKRRARYYLTFKAYHVVGLIRKALGNGDVVAMSATVGNPDIFRFETGLQQPFQSFCSSFPADRCRIFHPTDTPNLSRKKARRDDPKKAMRMIISACRRFADAGHRSLVVCTSDEERVKLLERAEREGLHALSYGNGVLARDVAMRFREDEGQILIGCAAHYGQGVDLPRRTAEVIFFLRPGYQRPDDPQTQFEERRFSDGHCWALWNWRVMIEALQVRGRNIRSADDVGVTFFISQQFRRFVYASLPRWLRESYVGDKSMDDCVADTLDLLKGGGPTLPMAP